MPTVLSPGKIKTQLRLETVSAGPSLSVPFRLSSWGITCYFIRDFTPVPTLSKLGCSEALRIPTVRGSLLVQEAEQEGLCSFWA